MYIVINGTRYCGHDSIDDIYGLHIGENENTNVPFIFKIANSNVLVEEWPQKKNFSEHEQDLKNMRIISLNGHEVSQKEI